MIKQKRLVENIPNPLTYGIEQRKKGEQEKISKRKEKGESGKRKKKIKGKDKGRNRESKKFLLIF